MGRLRLFFFFNRKVKIEKRDTDFLKTRPQCRLSYLTNFPEETVQIENGSDCIRVSLIIPSKYFICSRLMCMNCDLMHECYEQILISQCFQKKCSQSNSVSVIW